MLVFIMPIHGSLLYLFHSNGGDFRDTSYIASAVLLLLTYLYWNRNVVEFGIRSLIICLRILSGVILLATYNYFFGMNSWVSFFTEKNVAIVGFREYGGVVLPYIYFLASPMLIFLLAFDWDKLRTSFSPKRLLIFMCTTLVLFFSGTRAHMLIAVLYVPVYFLITASIKSKIWAFAVITLASIYIFQFEATLGLVKDAFSTKEASNLAKISMFTNYGSIFSDPLTLLLGQGYNAHEWSSEFASMIAMEDYASKTELTYLELIRVYGLFLTFWFLVFLSRVLVRLRALPREKLWLYSGMCIYLINAAFNPYLFSVNGMLPLGLSLAVIIEDNKRKAWLKSPIS